MEKCIFSKICTDKGTTLRLYVTTLDKSLRLTLLQEEQAWKTTISEEELVYFAEQHQHSLDDYREKLLEHLSTDNPDVIFTLNEAEFAISRPLNSSLKVKFFSCSLEKANYVNEVEQFIDTLHLKCKSISQQLDNVAKERNEINESKSNCEAKLKELVNQKLSDENEHLGQFVLILNEKKRRIQHLEELLEAFKGGRPTVNPAIVPKIRRKRTKKPSQKQETISDSGSSAGSEHQESECSSDEESGSSSKLHNEIQSAEASGALTDTELLDLLGGDGSHSPSLPKRIKPNSAANDITGTAAPPEPPQQETREADQNEASGTPEIDFNTQQLLDML